MASSSFDLPLPPKRCPGDLSAVYNNKMPLRNIESKPIEDRNHTVLYRLSNGWNCWWSLIPILGCHLVLSYDSLPQTVRNYHAREAVSGLPSKRPWLPRSTWCDSLPCPQDGHWKCATLKENSSPWLLELILSLTTKNARWLTPTRKQLILSRENQQGNNQMCPQSSSHNPAHNQSVPCRSREATNKAHHAGKQFWTENSPKKVPMPSSNPPCAHIELVKASKVSLLSKGAN